MISQKIIYTDPSGNLCILYPAEQDKLSNELESDFLNRIKNKDIPLGSTNVNIVDVNIPLPPRKFRSCYLWDNTTKSVVLDPVKVKSLILKDIRATRNNLLDLSDKDKAKLDDVGTLIQKTQLSTYRQQLRDLPTNVDKDITNLTTSQLISYVPTFPIKPEV